MRHSKIQATGVLALILLNSWWGCEWFGLLNSYHAIMQRVEFVSRRRVSSWKLDSTNITRHEHLPVRRTNLKLLANHHQSFRVFQHPLLPLLLALHQKDYKILLVENIQIRMLLILTFAAASALGKRFNHVIQWYTVIQSDTHKGERKMGFTECPHQNKGFNHLWKGSPASKKPLWKTRWVNYNNNPQARSNTILDVDGFIMWSDDWCLGWSLIWVRAYQEWQLQRFASQICKSRSHHAALSDLIEDEIARARTYLIHWTFQRPEVRILGEPKWLQTRHGEASVYFVFVWECLEAIPLQLSLVESSSN